ncbi:hypothetical protein E8E13_010797 [Curvularia kusanoi]|uniref:Uncharacterized protein n=1 Tax=Curvularia kusanoi TaxID=90978 RepID=A0A9P4TP34_CURKU|nr:hypothetical protein E8E13_010797 [Curvularia kusanoi]
MDRHERHCRYYRPGHDWNRDDRMDGWAGSLDPYMYAEAVPEWRLQLADRIEQEWLLMQADQAGGGGGGHRRGDRAHGGRAHGGHGYGGGYGGGYGRGGDSDDEDMYQQDEGWGEGRRSGRGQRGGWHSQRIEAGPVRGLIGYGRWQ